MSIIKSEMPLLVRHEGDWKGTYTVMDNEGNVIERYQSHITCQFPADGNPPYFQTNRYQWPDGKCEEHYFPGNYRDKKLWFDTERVEGCAWEADDATIIFRFSFKTVPDAYIYETIFLSPCGNHRARTWHIFKNNQIYQRTMVNEERVQ